MKININLSNNRIIKCDFNIIGKTFENEATVLHFNITEEMIDKDFYIEFEKPDGTKVSTSKLEIIKAEETGQYVEYAIPNSLLDIKGNLKSEVVLRKNGIVFKTYTLNFTILRSINASEEVAEKYPDFISNAQEVLDDTKKALEDVEKALPVGGKKGQVLTKNSDEDYDSSWTDAGQGDMTKEVYDTSQNGIVDNAEKVNNHTVEKDVPSNAVFTDTIYDDTDIKELIKTNQEDIEANATNITRVENKIPINVSQLTNDSGYLTEYAETDPTVPNHVKSITQENITSWNNKSDFDGSYNSLEDKPTIPSKTSQLTNDKGYISSIPSEYITEKELDSKGYLTSESDPTVPSYVKNITEKEILKWNTDEVTKLNGTTENPIILKNLSSGLYSLTGKTVPYSGGQATTYSNSFAMVQSTTTYTYVQVFYTQSDNIQFYKINNNQDTFEKTTSSFLKLEEKPTISKNTSATTLTTQLANNLFLQVANELTSLTLLFPTIEDNYKSRITFKSGTTATTFICNTEIKWYGDDVSNNIFTPKASKNYYIEFYQNVDGLNAYVRPNYIGEIPTTLLSNGADMSEVALWSDGNPNNEDRLYRFVSISGSTGNEVILATSTSQIAGTTNLKSNVGFLGNYNLDDENDSSKCIVSILGVSLVKTNDSSVVANDRVMSDENGYAIKSSNNCGYRVIEVLENGLLKIVISPNTDMIQSIKSDVVELESEAEDLYKALKTETATGDYINIDNAMPCRLLDTKVDGKYEQETLTGKNLFKPVATQTKVGMSLTYNSDGSYTLNGTATSNTSFYVVGLNYEAGTYALSLNNSLAISNDSFYVQMETSSGNGMRTFNIVNASKIITTTTPITALSIVIPNGLTLNNFVFKPQLETGSVVTDYEPYTGGKAIPNPDYPQEIEQISEVSYVGTGKNLCSGITQNYFLLADVSKCGQIIGDSGLVIEIKDNQTYTISTQTVQTRYRIACVNELPQLQQFTTAYQGINKDNTSETLTIDGTSYKYLIVNATDLTKIQVEVGQTATSYEPYQNQTINIDLKGNTINAISKTDSSLNDYLVVDRKGNYGIWKRTGKVVLDGVHNVFDYKHPSLSSDNKGFYRFKLPGKSISYSSGEFGKELSNYFVEVSGAAHIAFGNNSSGLWWEGRTEFSYIILEKTSLIEANNWLSIHNTIVYYGLETPEFIDLGTLSEIPNTFKGVNNISVETNLGSTNIEIEYVEDLQKAIDNLQSQINTINTLLSTTQTSAMLLDNYENDLESEV